MKSIILYNQLTQTPGPDEADVLSQVLLVRQTLEALGAEVEELQFSLRLDLVEQALLRYKPNFVFNLVESVSNRGSLVHFAPSLLSSLAIPYTGSGVEAMFLTTSKVLAKEIMASNGIPTAPWCSLSRLLTLEPSKRYIVKPVWEEGSLGLDEDCVFSGNNPKLVERINTPGQGELFIEEYIEGREFNISVLAGSDGPEVLPPAEIVFTNYPEGKPRVVGYTAKWVEDSFECINTQRTFKFQPTDKGTLRKLKAIALRCWHLFGLNGYARIDFRVDRNGKPWVLEVNANPCISPDSGFFAACAQGGIPFADAVRRIVSDIPSPVALKLPW